ncbi:MAG TPA: MarR family winged helix-turn-helix transcriptional regulator [Candidatus Sulfotelmatobacter sp.]|nr:MarR family winged helix-turn-helix transcriptional regulator [Candidatus Sulfotelmatobacter sp.]
MHLPSIAMSVPQSLLESNLSLEPSVCAALRAANRAVSQLYDLVLAPTGLRATQFTLLLAIYEPREIAQWQFARDHTVAVETLSRRFGALRKKGYVQLRKGNHHGERIYSLTKKGQQAVAEALPYWVRAQERLQRALGENDWGGMLQMLDRIRLAAFDAEQLRTQNRVN